ncbi:MAG TPA: metallophosphoesterase [Flavobacteriales bacterium]|nr:metallophosphoesterase [Flavobacteriales bacterium]
MLTSCEDVFVEQPWEVDVPDDLRDLNAAAIIELQNSLTDANSSFSFAVVGDPHFYYDDLDDVLDHINGDGTTRFTLVAGDLSDQALTQEFTWYARIATTYDKPVVSLIGNHDHLANGRLIYERMFGPRDQVFVAGGVRFVLFDNVELESEVPVDHDWLAAALAAPFAGQTVVFMHIQPTDLQLQGQPGAVLNSIMESHRPAAVFMGHLHGYSHDTFSGGTPWTTAPWPRSREYLRVTVDPDTVVHERITVP